MKCKHAGGIHNPLIPHFFSASVILHRFVWDGAHRARQDGSKQGPKEVRLARGDFECQPLRWPVHWTAVHQLSDGKIERLQTIENRFRGKESRMREFT
jgi:hypothetical protein